MPTIWRSIWCRAWVFNLNRTEAKLHIMSRAYASFSSESVVSRYNTFLLIQVKTLTIMNPGLIFELHWTKSNPALLLKICYILIIQITQTNFVFILKFKKKNLHNNFDYVYVFIVIHFNLVCKYVRLCNMNILNILRCGIFFSGFLRVLMQFSYCKNIYIYKTMTNSRPQSQCKFLFHC